MLELSEPINVWAFFKGSTITPYVFFWKNRRIKIDKINLIHSSKESSRTQQYFSVSTATGGFYRLKLDQVELKWFLEAVEEE